MSNTSHWAGSVHCLDSNIRAIAWFLDNSKVSGKQILSLKFLNKAAGVGMEKIVSPNRIAPALLYSNKFFLVGLLFDSDVDT